MENSAIHCYLPAWFSLVPSCSSRLPAVLNIAGTFFLLSRSATLWPSQHRLCRTALLYGNSVSSNPETASRTVQCISGSRAVVVLHCRFLLFTSYTQTRKKLYSFFSRERFPLSCYIHVLLYTLFNFAQLLVSERKRERKMEKQEKEEDRKRIAGRAPCSHAHY